MSNHQILTGLNRCLVGYDAVFWYAYAEEAGAEGTQTANENCVLEAGDDPGHQWTPNQHRAYCRHPEECGAKQQTPESAPESALLPQYFMRSPAL